jgi:hypothetical protein
MRIRAGVIASVASILLAQGALVVLPEAASAEWTESSRPCDVGSNAILVTQPFLIAGELSRAPEGYFTYGEEPGKEPPVSDFTALANWGDGATSLASVEPGSVGDCYVVTAPEHTYANAGTYQFSYTVHDGKTGLEHTLDTTGLQVVSEVPNLVGGPSSRTVDTTVGEPWSGVVGEFSIAEHAIPFYVDSAQIEWGNGEPSTAGTISWTEGKTFTVSGLFTYARPFRGTIGVSLLHGTQVLGTWATSSVVVEGLPGPNLVRPTKDLVLPVPVRLRGRPILAAIPRKGRGPVYELVFATTQPLPRTGTGQFEAVIEGGGRSSQVSALLAHGTSTCYLARAVTVGKHEPKPGSRYPFALSLDTTSPTHDAGDAFVRSFPTFARLRSAGARQLGCT